MTGSLFPRKPGIILMPSIQKYWSICAPDRAKLAFFFTHDLSKIPAEMILERLNLPDLLEEEKKNLQELEKLKESQKTNPIAQRKSPCIRSEINRTTGIIVERTIEDIKSINHVEADVSNVPESIPPSDYKETEKKISENKQVKVTDGESNHPIRASQITSTTTTTDGTGNLLASQITSKNPGKTDHPNMDKSLNIPDVSLTEMLNSSNEDEDAVNVSSIIGSLRVGPTFTDLASQSSVIGSNVQERNGKSDQVPSRTSTPMRPQSGGSSMHIPANKIPSSKDQQSLASTYNGPHANTDSVTNPEKSAIRKTIESRLTQVNYRTTVSEQSKNEMDSNNDFLTAIEGEHKLICVTDKQAKKSKENAGKKLSSKLKQKLNIAASKDKQAVEEESRNNDFKESDDFEAVEKPTVVGRKRKRIAIIDDNDDDDDDNETSKTNKIKGKMDKSKTEAHKHLKLKCESDKRRKAPKCKKNEKDIENNPKESDSGNKELNKSTDVSTSGSAVSNKTLSKLQKFAFDDSRSSSSDSFLSNTSLTSSMLSGSLWIPDKRSGKSSQNSDLDNGNDGSVQENLKNKIEKAAKFVSEEVHTIAANDGKRNTASNEMKLGKDEKTADNNIQTSTTLNLIIKNQCDSVKNKKLSQNDRTAIGKKVDDFKLNPTKSTSDLKTSISILQSKENTSSLNRSSALLTGTSPSWLMALKSKKPSPIFTVSETNDLDLDLDDLEFPENPLKKPKFS